MVLRRLDALLDADETGHPPMVELARRAGLGRAAFFDTRRRWLEERSLAAIIPFSRVPAREAVDRGATRPAAARVAELVRRSPDFVAAGAIARELMREVGAGLAFPTALRLVRKERSLAALEPGYLVANYGRVLLVDACAIGIPVERPGGSGAAIAALVIERASRLVLAAIAGAPDGIATLQNDAIGAAIAMVANNGVDRAADSSTTLEVVMAEGAEPRLQRGPHTGGAVLDLARGGDRRFGQRVVSLLGSRMGRLELLPRSTMTGALGAGLAGRNLAPVTDAHAALLVAEAAREHNVKVLAALRAAEASGLPLVGRGKIVGALSDLRI